VVYCRRPYLVAADARGIPLRHIVERSVGVIAGRASVAGGIVLLVNPIRHRRRARSRWTVHDLEAPQVKGPQDAQPEAEREDRRDPTIEQGAGEERSLDRHKAAVVVATPAGAINREQACERDRLPRNELAA
jgi:hypothetical protein